MNLYSEDLKLLANTASKFFYNILIIICKKENANAKTHFLFFVIIPMINLIPGAEAHSMFNSGEEWIGDHRIQIATLPEIPSVDEEIQVLFQVVDADFQELDQFTMGIRIFYDGEQIDAVMPKMYQNGHMEMDYIFEMSGNHIFRVDLYDIADDGQPLTYTFNISSQNTFGFVFISAVTMGGMMTAIIFVYVYWSKRRSKSKQ